MNVQIVPHGHVLKLCRIDAISSGAIIAVQGWTERKDDNDRNRNADALASESSIGKD